MAVINAALITSLTHITIAVSRALVNKRDGKLRTECLGNEIVYFCDAQHSIQHSLSNYGIQHCTGACFVVFVDFPPEAIQKVKTEIKSLMPEASNLNDHIQYQDVERIVANFKLTDKEKALPSNGVLTSIYTKLALKGI